MRAVASARRRRPLMLRRSRGYVPGEHRPAGRATRPLLACGAELKSTFCLARGRPRLGRPPHRRSRALPGLRRLPAGRRPLRAAVRVRPEVVAHDLHPDYASTALRAGAGRRRAASASSTTTPIWPRAWPSTAWRARPSARSTTASGYGTDGTIWGGEMLVGDLTDVRARGVAARPCACPAATRAVREPWRMACAWLAAALGRARRAARDARGRASTAAAGTPSRRSARARAVSPETTSMGRLFDAVAALCGLARSVSLRGSGGGRA